MLDPEQGQIGCETCSIPPEKLEHRLCRLAMGRKIAECRTAGRAALHLSAGRGAAVRRQATTGILNAPRCSVMLTATPLLGRSLNSSMRFRDTCHALMWLCTLSAQRSGSLQKAGQRDSLRPETLSPACLWQIQASRPLKIASERCSALLLAYPPLQVRLGMSSGIAATSTPTRPASHF